MELIWRSRLACVAGVVAASLVLANCQSERAKPDARVDGTAAAGRISTIFAIGTAASAESLYLVRVDRRSAGDAASALCDSTGIYVAHNGSMSAVTTTDQRLCDLLWSGHAVSLRQDGTTLALADVFDSSRVTLVTFARGKLDFKKLDCLALAPMPAWSPDGRHLAMGGACAGHDPSPSLIVLGDGYALEHRVHLRAGVDRWGSLTWSPNARQLAYAVRGASADSIIVVDLESGRDRAVAMGSEPSWSPTGQWIAYVRRSRDKPLEPEIRLFSPAGARDSLLLGGGAMAMTTDSGGFIASSPVLWSRDGRTVFVSTLTCIEAIDIGTRHRTPSVCLTR